MAIDENVVAVVAASCRAGTFNALTRGEHADFVRSIILAYKAARPVSDHIVEVNKMVQPVPPMSTSGEMVERLRGVTEEDAYASPWSFGQLCREAASRIEALEARALAAEAALEGRG